MSQNQKSLKPYVVIAAAGSEGHTGPCVRIAQELYRRGYDITLIGFYKFEDKLSGTGINFIPLPFVTESALAAKRAQLPPGLTRFAWDMEHIFLPRMIYNWVVLKSELERLKAQNPERELVILSEIFFLGANPLALEIELPIGFEKKPKIIVINTMPYMGTSIDTGPFGPGLLPDNSSAGRQRNLLINDIIVNNIFKSMLDRQDNILDNMGAKKRLTREMPFHNWALMHDVLIQLCPRECEYDRSDLPSHVVFSGILPLPASDGFLLPEWWEEKAQGKKVVFVTQGTIAVDYTNLIIPTINALQDNNNLLVIAVLGVKGASLPDDFSVPSNTIVMDYFPYQPLLEKSDVFVMNAGYGGFLQGVANGVPMVLAGLTEDKAEVSARGEWAGVAINLRTQFPTPDALSDAVNQILDDGTYKRKAEQLKRLNENLRAFDVIEHHITQDFQ